VRNNVRFADLRVRGADDRPLRELVKCDNLRELMHEVVLDPDRDFYLRLTSFSIAQYARKGGDGDLWRAYREAAETHLPWLKFSLRSKEEFKDEFAKSLNLLLPRFDLVVMDEGHNLKHGFGDQVATRNRVLGIAMGHPDLSVDRSLFKHYGPRAGKVLFLSATPLEGSYAQLWNQLDVFGKGGAFKELIGKGTEEEKQEVARKFLIRRVNRMRVAGQELTKNQYRREWRAGGVHLHDEPMAIDNDRQKLVVALVQKKVSELLDDPRFNRRFQIGMLASFESFLQTAKVDPEEGGTFDDADQTRDDLEREGIDVHQLNRLARDYRKEFDLELPHPKMDALVERLQHSWRTGEKALVFVRRVHSVRELKNKLDDSYDQWLLRTLLQKLTPAVHGRLKREYTVYRQEKSAFLERQRRLRRGADERTTTDADKGGHDTFFAWFFRGEPRKGVLSGAGVQQRFTDPASVYYTFFEDNYAALALQCPPGEVEERLARLVGMPVDAFREELRQRSAKFLSNARKHLRGHRFRAVQAAAIEWLRQFEGPHQDMAEAIWRVRFHGLAAQVRPHTREAPDIASWLGTRTFFTELRHRPALMARIWPVHDRPEDYPEQDLRAHLLAQAARFGHPVIDLYAMVVNRLGTLSPGRQEATEGSEADAGRAHDFLDLLDRQRLAPVEEVGWSAYHELEALSAHHQLIMDTNLSDLQEATAPAQGEVAHRLGNLFAFQEPTGGMHGRVMKRQVQQFRMPGYPFVLVTTDLLQEGEDLHPFCSQVYHYGMSWTPSSMEQRIGRIDRVRSQTERRLTGNGEPAEEDRKLQVLYPHLQDTVEVLQVDRVLERMNKFLRMMHVGLDMEVQAERTIEVDKAMLEGRRLVPQITEHLHTAFPVQEQDLHGPITERAVEADRVNDLIGHFRKLPEQLPQFEWERPGQELVLLGTGRVGERIQPFVLLPRSVGERLALRCIIPIGAVGSASRVQEVTDQAREFPVKIGAVESRDQRSYDLTAEGEVLLTGDAGVDVKRVSEMIGEVLRSADLFEFNLLDGRDEGMEVFRVDLEKELGHG
ncbi:MAG: DEAD/DEAH box helicase, partial [Flavobacteriales bacterium]|nr:DEAD/DEAH box helicase [Flavobacteriales bacterium]